jgi:hypothetical protein
MARQLRIEYAGAIYHVMSRGDRRETIFLDDEDRKGFLRNPEPGQGAFSFKQSINIFIRDEYINYQG